MSTMIVFVSLAIVIIIGFVNILFDHQKLIKKMNFASEYLTKFQQFKNLYTTNFDGETYYWLTYHVPKIQLQLGSFGIGGYQPPFANYIHTNYPIIINVLPEMRNGTADSSMINGCEEALIRYIGFLEDYTEKSMNQMKNPLKWFLEGVKLIISSPFLVFYWLGLISLSCVEKIRNNYIFQIFSGFIALSELIASIITIIIGWEKFVNLIQKLLSFV